MTSPTVRFISECFVKPLHDLPPDTKEPIYFTPFELVLLNTSYSQKGLLFAKPEKYKDFSVTTFLDNLRQSLSAALTHFYPLAARLATRKEENPSSFVISIDPEDIPGVKFVHATADVNVADIVDCTHVPAVVHSFFDLSNATNHDGRTLPLLSVQVTELTDGIFVGGSVNHLVADGTSFWHFMAAWSEIFRSKEKNTSSISRPPVFKRCILEGSDPIITLPYTVHAHEERSGDIKFKERFFHFSSVSVSRLKAKANAESKTRKISSLQAVSAVLWRCVTRARHQPPESDTVCKLVVSNRRRVKPPLSDDYFGSPINIVGATATVEHLMANNLGWAAWRLHEAVANYDEAAVRKWVESWSRNPVVYTRNGLFHQNCVHIGSSPRFDMYGCDFGLGKAVAARSGGVNKADGKMTMYPGRQGGGSMDVEVCLLPEYMSYLEGDEEFIAALKS